MDFLTMKENIDERTYENLDDYKAHYELVMRNAMTYNTPDTIYHKVAKKLLKIGVKQIEKERSVLDKMLKELKRKAKERLKAAMNSGAGDASTAGDLSAAGGSATVTASTKGQQRRTGVVVDEEDLPKTTLKCPQKIQREWTGCQSGSCKC